MVKIGKLDEIGQYRLYKSLIKGRIVDGNFQNIRLKPELDTFIQTVYGENVNGRPLYEIEDTEKFGMVNRLAKEIIKNLGIQKDPFRELVLESILTLYNEPTNTELIRRVDEAADGYPDLKNILSRHVQRQISLKQKTY